MLYVKLLVNHVSGRL